MLHTTIPSQCEMLHTVCCAVRGSGGGGRVQPFPDLEVLLQGSFCAGPLSCRVRCGLGEAEVSWGVRWGTRESVGASSMSDGQVSVAD